MENQFSGNSLTQTVVNLLVKGQSFSAIAQKLDVPQQEIVKVWTEYCSSRYAMPWEQQFILQSERLEALLVTANDILSMQLDSDAVQALLKVLQELDNLHNLALARREKVQVEQVELTKAQTAILLSVVSSIQAYMREKIQGITYEQFQELQNNFNAEFNQISRKALEEVKNDG